MWDLAQKLEIILRVITTPRVRFELTRPLRVTSSPGGSLQAGALPLDDLGTIQGFLAKSIMEPCLSANFHALG